MSARSRIAKRNLDFDSSGKKAESRREPISKMAKSRRVDFGETEQSVLSSHCHDLLPSRLDSDDSLSTAWCGAAKTLFTAEQKAQLEAKFRREKYPSRKDKVALAAKLGIGPVKVQTWFINRRRKWKKEQRNGAVGPSGSRPVLPGVSLIQTSYKQSCKSTVEFRYYPQFPAQLQVPSQSLTSAPFQASAPFATATHHATDSFAANSSGTQMYHQQPSSTVAVEAGPLPYQQMYPPFPGPASISQQQPLTKHIAEPTKVPSYSAHHSLHSENPVQPEFNQFTAAGPRSLADEFPFSEYEPLWDPLADSLALDSDQLPNDLEGLSEEDLVLCASPGHGNIQPLSYNTCWYNDMLSELSRGFISKGRSFSFLRHE